MTGVWLFSAIMFAVNLWAQRWPEALLWGGCGLLYTYIITKRDYD